MWIEVTHANTKEKVSLTSNLIFNIIEKNDGTSWVMASGGAIIPVLEKRKELERKINGRLSTQTERSRNQELSSGGDKERSGDAERGPNPGRGGAPYPATGGEHN